MHPQEYFNKIYHLLKYIFSYFKIVDNFEIKNYIKEQKLEFLFYNNNIEQNNNIENKNNINLSDLLFTPNKDILTFII